MSRSENRLSPAATPRPRRSPDARVRERRFRWGARVASRSALAPPLPLPQGEARGAQKPGAGRGASSGRRDECEPAVALGIEIAARRESYLLGSDRAQSVDVRELLAEPPHRLGLTQPAGAALGGLAGKRVLGL